MCRGRQGVYTEAFARLTEAKLLMMSVGSDYWPKTLLSVYTQHLECMIRACSHCVGVCVGVCVCVDVIWV